MAQVELGGGLGEADFGGGEGDGEVGADGVVGGVWVRVRCVWAGVLKHASPKGRGVGGVVGVVTFALPGRRGFRGAAGVAVQAGGEVQGDDLRGFPTCFRGVFPLHL